jgi:protein CpxP
MKLQNLSLIAGVIALTLTAAPFAVKAQSDSTGSPDGGTTQHHYGHHHGGGMWKDLNLTDDQKNQIKDIKKDARAKMKAVLTPEQLAQLKANRGQHQPHQKGQGPFASLGLSDDQKAQIKQINHDSWTAIKAVLTPDQLSKLQQKHQHHQQENNGN